ncbi:MAG TPA: tetratricopeptide repeat protein [Bryobacteraceae bacterium]|nr:tetratricopeptide repeat protein [Bryobacteraceae bacterium]
MDKLTRKELKSDKFALEVQHSVEFVSEHRRQMVQWAAPVVGLVLIVIGIFWYRSYQHNARQEALHSTMLIQNSTVGASQSEYVVSFPTAQARETAVVKAWRDLATKYPGTEEGDIAEFFLGTNAADAGNLPEAAKHFQAAIDSGSGPYASEAKLALAQIYAAQGKINDGIQLIQSVIDHPTVMVSKDAAVLAMADLIKTSDPQRARKMVEPLRTSTRSAVSKAAITLDSSLSQQ